MSTWADRPLRTASLLFFDLEGEIVVGHNLQFDFRFVTYEAERLGLSGIDVRFADTLGLTRSLLDAPNTHRLGTLHTAVGDALATCTLFWHLLEHGGLQTLADIDVQRLQWNAGA